MPRLTGFLRAHYAPQKEKTVDVEQQFLRREEQLRRKLKRSQSALPNQPKQLSWDFFAVKGKHNYFSFRLGFVFERKREEIVVNK